MNLCILVMAWGCTSQSKVGSHVDKLDFQIFQSSLQSCSMQTRLVYQCGNTVHRTLWLVCLRSCRHCWGRLCFWRGTFALFVVSGITMLNITFIITMSKDSTVEAVVFDVDLSTAFVLEWFRERWRSLTWIWRGWSKWGFPNMGRSSIVVVDFGTGSYFCIIKCRPCRILMLPIKCCWVFSWTIIE